MAMAERPAVFTLGPWGYRILAPWLVHSLPLPGSQAFRWVTAAGLLLSGGLLFLFLRRLGNGELASLLAVAAFALSAPVEAAVAYPFLTEACALPLLLGLLLALEAGAAPALLAPLAVLGALAKEVTLAFLPVVFFARIERDGWRRAARSAVLAALPALAASALLRLWWAPAAPAPGAQASLWLASWRLVERSPDWLGPALLHGVTPLALLGALRAGSRRFLFRYGYLLAAALALPFAASVYTDDPSVPFFLDDIPRLLVYALPLLLALALAALDRVWPHRVPAPAPWRHRPRIALAGAVAAGLVALAPLLLQDRYRRADLRGPRDGRLVLALARESLATADRLERGGAVAYDPETRRFVPRKTVPSLAGRMRWFLRDGWGPKPHYGTGPVLTAEPEAALLVPSYGTRDLTLGLLLSAPEPRRVRVSLNGRVLGEAAVSGQRARHRFRAPRSAWFRGDNVLRLASEAPGLRLHQLLIHPER
jgi:hypothetical protein